MTVTSPAADPAVFPSAGEPEWAALVRAEQKGRDPATLGVPTREGLPRKVVYTASDLPADASERTGAPWRRGSLAGDALPAPRPWIAVQRHADADLDRLNRALREDVEGGVDGLWVDLRASGADSLDRLDAAFAGVDLSALRYLGFDGCSGAHGRLATVIDWLSRAGVDAKPLPISVRADPLRTLAVDGVVPGDLDEALDRLAAAVRQSIEALPNARPITLTAEPILLAGGHTLHALGWLLANGAWVLRGLEARGLSAEQIAPRIELHLPLGRDLFVGIAAVRALRIAWTRLLVACGVPSPAPPFVHTDAAAGGASRNDCWVNMLRGTGQVFAGVLGGADAITAAPFDRVLGTPDRLGRRVARNTHHVLGEEAHLADVLDPAGGSWYLENLTDQLARGAWGELQAIEGAGGAATALTSGWLGERLDAAWANRRTKVARRKVPITGVSEFANPAETVPTRAAAPVVDTAGTVGVRMDPLPLRRDAEDFERLRKATAAAPPTAFLATVGPRPEWNARALWVGNAFAAGGLMVQEDDGAAPDDLDALIARYEASGAGIACIVASDARYLQAVPELAPRLSALGPVLLAGRPPESEAETWRAAGVGAYLHVGADIHGLLSQLLTDLGVLR